MKKNIIFLGILQFMFSCSNGNHSGSTKEGNNNNIKSTSANSETEKQYTLNPADLLTDFKTWYEYNYNNISLFQDFVGLDTDSSIIKKADFLNRLSTGNYIPIKIMVKEKKPFYKLYRINKTNLDIESTIRRIASTEIIHYEMEGKELSDYTFIDVNGNAYTKNTTKGKILVLKCWFIRCVACVREFPDLNKLVEENKDRDDILFISLAIDSKQELTSFLKTKEFKYTVVPGMEDYMSEQLHVAEYPTHILIDKDGRVVKVVNVIDDLLPFIKKELRKASL